VADELDISPRTIEGHRRRIREELGLRNVVEMTRYAVHMGLYSTPQSDWLNRTVKR
jgi:DNA-binding CsgD family transcriptional regulator